MYEDDVVVMCCGIWEGWVVGFFGCEDGFLGELGGGGGGWLVWVVGCGGVWDGWDGKGVGIGGGVGCLVEDGRGGVVGVWCESCFGVEDGVNGVEEVVKERLRGDLLLFFDFFVGVLDESVVIVE